MYAKLTGGSDFTALTGVGAGNLLTVLSTTLQATGFDWTEDEKTTTGGYNSLILSSDGSSLYTFPLAVRIRIHATNDANYLLIQASDAGTNTATFEAGHTSDEVPLYFKSTDTAGMTLAHLYFYVSGDDNGFAITAYNSDDSISNTVVYGRLNTPTGEPADALNSTAVDVTGIMIGSTCREEVDQSTNVTSGTVTGATASATTLIATGDTFVTDAVVAGDTVYNLTDGSKTKVLAVYSQTQLNCAPLEGGRINKFTSGDSYKVIRFNAPVRDGFIQVYRDARGNYWEDYMIYDGPVNAHNYYGGGLGAKYNQWGQKTVREFMQNLFLKDVYWRDRVNYMGVFHKTEGFRGAVPYIYTMNEALNLSGEFKTFLTPSQLITSGTATGGDTNTLQDTAVNFTTLGVEAYDVIYKPSSRSFLRVDGSAIGTTTVDTVDVLAAANAWTSGDAYEIYRGVSFDLFEVGFDFGANIPKQEFAITGVNEASSVESFSISGDWHALFTDTDTFTISGSTANDGTYTCDGDSTFSGGATIITVAEDIPDATIDGNVVLAFAIGAVDQTTSLTVAADVSAVYLDGVSFEVFGSTGNDGTYTCDGDSTGMGTTAISVNEALVDGTVDGNIAPTASIFSVVNMDAIGNTITIDGDQTTDFLNTDTFELFGHPTHDGTLTLTSDSTLDGNGDTILSVASITDDTVQGYVAHSDNVDAIIAVDEDEVFRIDGADYTSYFTAVSTFVVSGSTGNDGTYTVASSSFSGGNTLLKVDEAITDGTADGDILRSNAVTAVDNVGAGSEGGAFTFAGNFASSFVAGDTFIVSGSSNNDGTFTVTVSENSGTNTQLTVSETVGAVADGVITPSSGTLAPKVHTNQFTPAENRPMKQNSNSRRRKIVMGE